MNLNQRSLDILKLLMQNNEKTFAIGELARDYNISERSIRYDLDNIDYFLESNNLPKLKRNIRIEIDLDDSLKSNNGDEPLYKKLNRNETYYPPRERRNIIYLELLIGNHKNSIDYFIELLNVSRSTINTDINNLKKELKEINVSLSYSNKTGYKLEGNEHKIRRKAMNIISNNINLMDFLSSRLTNTDIKFKVINYFESLIEEVEVMTGKVFTGNAFQTLVNSLLLVLYRIKGSHFIDDLMDSSTSLSNIKEYIILKNKCKEIEEKFSISIPQEEIAFLVNLFLESNLLRANDYLSENWIDLHILINNLIESVSTRLKVDLTNDWDLFEALVLHLGPAFKRMEGGVYLKNEILNFIQETYSEIYKIVSESLNKLTANMNLQFTSDEVGYVTLHIASSVEKMTIDKKRLNVLLVCDSGLGTSKLLESRIKKHFSFHVINTISVRDLTNDLIHQNYVDLIISTISINAEYHAPVLTVSPLLTNEEIKVLRDFEINSSSNRRKRTYLVPEINIGGYIPMLNDLLIKETILTNVSVKNWEDAVREGGRLLLNEGYIESEYIQAMINSVKELGPYVVIAPNIAMPHARPNESVNKVGISLITLKEPVEFGHEENDPVKIVICLAAINHSSHLKALSELVNYLNNKEFVELLKNEQSVDKIIHYINEEEKNGFPSGDK